MKNNLLQLAFYLMALVLGSACEEFSPRLLSIGVPILLAMTFSVASRKPLLAGVLLSLVAGAFEDALSSLPPLTSPCFFLVMAATARRLHAVLAGWPRLVIPLVAYPLYILWLMLIVPGAAFSASGLLLSMPIAALTALGVDVALTWLERKVALDVA